MINNIFKKAIIALFVLIGIISQKSNAQLTPMGAAYFQNQYLANPAMAGIGQGLNVNLGYRQQWGNIPGAPKTQAITADYQLNKIGLGLNLYNDAAGLLKNTRLISTYAYHLPLNKEGQQLHFGISLGFMYQRILTEDANGNPNDATANRVNQRETYMDGDFGIAYTSNKFTIQASIPNLKNFIEKGDNNSVDYTTFFSAASYRFSLNENLKTVIEPKVCFRGVKGFHNMLDVGANVTIANNQVIFSGMYHSSKSATFGFGFNFRQSVTILGMYTTENSPINGNLNGTYEIGLKFNLLKK